MQKAVGEYYHVFNRGVEKRDIFIDDEDRFRFIHDLYEFNDKDVVINIAYYFESQKRLSDEFAFQKAIRNLREFQRSKKRKLLVDIVCYCLMPNHFHLIVSPKIENGLSLFMQKLDGGYTRYFNYKYDRVGPLLQGKYKAKHLADDIYFLHCTGYVHRNPLKLAEPEWKEKGFSSKKNAERILTNYRWSSFLDYVGIKNFPSIINSNFLLKIFGDKPDDYKKFVLDWADKDLKILQEAKLTID